MSNAPINYNGLSPKFNPNCRKIVESLFEWLQTTKWGRGIWPGSGWRANSAEHATGRAVDIITVEKTGRAPSREQHAAAMLLVAELIRRGKELGIKWILYAIDGKVTHSFNISRGTWVKLNDRGSVSANHIDHIHVYFETWARLPNGFQWDRNIPIQNHKPIDDGRGVKLVDVVSVKNLKAARYDDPPKSGRPLGPHADEVFTMETALAKTRWIYPDYADGHFGTQTVGNGTLGYGGTTGFQRKHSSATRPDGWLGPRELRKLFSLAKMNVRVVS